MAKQDRPVSQLHGVGPAMEKRLKTLGLETLGDLVWYFPRQHEDLSAISDVIDVADGQKVTVRVRIEKLQARRSFRRRMTITDAKVGDDTSSIKVVWFNQPHIATSLAVGDEVFMSGVAKESKYGLALQSPVYEKADGIRETTHTGRIVPAYHLTHGITQKQLRYFMKQALKLVLPLPDYLPEVVLEETKVLPLTKAIEQIHFPESLELFEEARRRLDFDELYVSQLFAQLQRKDIQSQNADAQEFHETEVKAFVDSLPFTLTAAQKKSAWQILKDLQAGVPMNRLLIGDVGSGKTVVAAIAMLNTVLNKQQAALMAPTEILAKQHFATLQELFADSNVSVELLTSSSKTAAGAGQGQLAEPDIKVGTHALIQDSVDFSRLGLAVVDEQHRFGVKQRKALKENSGNADTMPHLLSMTATPIPRTLALAVYGDLDLSLIDEMPKGRKPVTTHVVPPQKREKAYAFVREHVAKGEQCFVICPLIDPSDKLGVKSVTTEYEKLHEVVFPDLKVEMLHGKMKPDEKDDIMKRMKDKQVDVLVATSVIEVGVDIPDATIMVIEGAERFGLAQLHQFRGRVGRSDKQSWCFLFSDSDSDRSAERLQALAKSNDGFELAEIDLKMRGAGEVFGTLQSGFSDMALIAYQQPELLEEARKTAEMTLEQGLIDTHPLLQKKINAFIKRIHLE
ncbi:MAG: ATP-dependent DNA helicase RecG [Candidatus Kerfeldbacteria bacterium]